MPELSMVVTVYNRAKYLRKTLLSLIAECRVQDEIVVVDDGSTDSSLEMISDLPVRVIRHNENLGQASAQNTGIKAARGEYVAFFDSDDLLLPGGMARRLEWLQAHKANVVAGMPSDVIDSEDNRLGDFWDIFFQGRKLAPTLISEKYFKEGGEFPSPMWLLMFRKDFLDRVGAFNPQLRVSSDNEYWHRIVQHAEVPVIHVPVSRYRLHGSNLCGKLVNGQFRYARQALAENLLLKLNGSPVETNRVPLGIRSKAAFTLSLPGLRPLALASYETLTQLMAKAYQRLNSKIRVLHFGGSLGRCVPGISDVDFLLLTPDPVAAQADVLKTFHRFKRQFLIPGEIHLCSPAHWENYLLQPFASRLWFLPMREWKGAAGWSIEGPHITRSAPASCFYAAFLHFQRAVHLWVQLLQNPNFFLKRSFIRETSKASALAQAMAPAQLREGNPKRLLRECHQRLHRLAEEIPNIGQETLDPEAGLWNTSFAYWKKSFPAVQPSRIAGTVLLPCTAIDEWLEWTEQCFKAKAFQRPQIWPVAVTPYMESVLVKKQALWAEESRFLTGFFRFA